MFDVEIKTNFNTIHISVEKMEDLEEILSMPYVISYKKKGTDQCNYKILKKIQVQKEKNNYGRKSKNNC